MMMMVMQPDDMSSEALQSEPTVERKEVLSTFEDAYRCIKEATGVTNVQVVLCVLLYHLYSAVNKHLPPSCFVTQVFKHRCVNANCWFLTNEFVSLDGCM